VVVFLGSQWTAAAPIFRLLAVASLVQLVTTTCGWLFVSSGRAKAAVGWAAFGTTVTVVAFLVGVRWGVNGVAAAYAISQVVLAAPALAVASWNTPVRFADPLVGLLRPTAVAAIVLASTLAVSSAVPPGWPALVRLLLIGASAVAAWFAVIASWRSARAEVRDLVSVIRRKEGK
jgi:PST family polysaccharide transporter